MPRKSSLDDKHTSEFTRWLRQRVEMRHTTLSAVAQHADINVSYLHKVSKSHLPQYKQYRRLSFEKTVKIGEYLGDVGGALWSAGYAETYQAAAVGDMTLRMRDGRAAAHEDAASLGEVPERAEDWPPELLEAMHYSQTLDLETQRYIYGLWREQARVYAAAQDRVQYEQSSQEPQATEKSTKNAGGATRSVAERPGPIGNTKKLVR